MTGLVDLHCHYLPAIDDGVRTLDEGLELLRGLRNIGFAKVVATPHIRTAMFENRKPGIEETFARFVEAAAEAPGLPELGLGAEHFFDDLTFELLLGDDGVPYPGGHAALVEFPPNFIPRGIEHRFFELGVHGIKPVLAHPERYPPLFKSTDPIDPLLQGGTLPLLDVMSLTGKYGRHPKRAAERMLAEDVYYAACTDAHKPAHVPVVKKGIERLRKLVGPELAEELLAENPRRILDGTAEY